jgi:N-methylhydantoinase A
MPAPDTYAIGIDIGGTFTDVAAVRLSDVAVTVTKVPTTPANPAIGFFAGIDALAAKLSMNSAELLGRTERLVHGTTHGTNALVARRGVKVGLIATAGHGDAISVMKGGGRTSGLAPDRMLHVPSTGKPAPYVPRRLIAEAPERIDSDGEIVIPLDEAAARGQVVRLLEQDVEAIAISLLWSIRNPSHELRLREIVKELAPQIYVCCGHEIGVTTGEYARTMATVFNAYIGPLMVDYVGEIEAGVAARGLQRPVLFAQCAGGAITGDEVRAAPVRTLQSGPVSGVVASAFLARALGTGDIITADMGGTTLDVAVIPGHSPMTRHLSKFERFDLALPMLDLDSVGAGGGSIAWCDPSGGLQVGPRSAGSVPGPACYGTGGVEPTVTDADVVLGVIDPERFLHGAMKLDRGLAEAAIDRLAARLGLSRLETAAGINRIVDSRMAGLIQRMGVMRGFDPRDFTLYAFGGAGPVHAGAIAREAGVSRVVVPLLNVSSVWSAFGAATADISYVHQEPVLVPMPADPKPLAARFAALEARGRASLPGGAVPGEVEVSMWARMRYAMQVHDIEVAISEVPRNAADVAALTERFHEVYEGVFGPGAGYREGGVVITGLGVRVNVPVAKPAIGRVARGAANRSSRLVYWDELGAAVETPVVATDGPGPEGEMPGPLLVTLPDTVVAVRPGQSACFDDFGNLVITTEAGHA